MKYQDIIERERAADKALDDFKKEIVEQIRRSESVPGVKTGEQNGIRCGEVRFSTISANRFNLSPRTYLQSSQADAVQRYIAPASKTYELLDRLRIMDMTGRVNFGNGDSVVLNGSTISIIHKILD